MTFHQNEILLWPGLKGNLKPEEFPHIAYQPPRVKTAGRTRQLRVIMEEFKLKKPEDVNLRHLIGQQINVKWSQLGNRWYPGTVTALEGGGKFWIRYDENEDIIDDEGSYYRLESLLG